MIDEWDMRYEWSTWIERLNVYDVISFYYCRQISMTWNEMDVNHESDETNSMIESIEFNLLSLSMWYLISDNSSLNKFHDTIYMMESIKFILLTLSIRYPSDIWDSIEFTDSMDMM